LLEKEEAAPKSGLSKFTPGKEAGASMLGL
jgi:hypothetical protein